MLAKAKRVHRSAQFLKIFRIYGNSMRISTENQEVVFEKKLAFWEHQFWGSSMMTLSSFLTKFKSCRGKLIKIKQNEKSFCEDISQRIENDPGLLDLNDLNDFDHCGLCGHMLHFLSPEFGHRTLNCPSVKYIVPVKISPALPLCRKNWVCGKVHIDDFCRLLRSKSSRWIHIGVKRIS